MQINCEHGMAYMSLCPKKQILVCGSLVNTSYWTLPPHFILNIADIDIIVNTKDCEDMNIIDYKTACELKVDIISTNSICLRLYKKEVDRDETIVIGFCITSSELLKIAQKYLLYINTVE